MKLKHLAAGLGALLLTFNAAAANTPSDKEIGKILVDRIDGQKKSVGIVVGVIDANGRSRVISYGNTEAGSKTSVDGDTIFEIGSATKVFTSLLLANAALRGDVALDDPIAKYLPSVVHIVAYGAMEYLGERGVVLQRDTPSSLLEIYRRYCEKNGIPPVDLGGLPAEGK